MVEYAERYMENTMFDPDFLPRVNRSVKPYTRAPQKTNKAVKKQATKKVSTVRSTKTKARTTATVRTKSAGIATARVGVGVNTRRVSRDVGRVVNPNVSIKKESSSYLGTVLYIVGIFVCIFIVSCSYSAVNSVFAEKEKMKNELGNVQKQNAQLQVAIEQKLNISNIEQEAKARLGMQKLDNSQKVYVTLEKKDYTESSSDTIKTDTDETWVNKFNKLVAGND